MTIIISTKETKFHMKQKIKSTIHGISQPSAILRLIREENLPEITEKQLTNLKARHNKKTLGASSVSLADLIEWCENKKLIPEDNDEVFVGTFTFKTNENNKIKYVRIFVTTKRLIMQATLSMYCIHIV
jgi:hypothetical protein